MSVKYFDVKGKCIVWVKVGASKDCADGQIISVVDPADAISQAPEMADIDITKFPISEYELKTFGLILRPAEEYEDLANLCAENARAIDEKNSTRVLLDVAKLKADAGESIIADWADTGKMVDPVEIKSEDIPIIRADTARS